MIFNSIPYYSVQFRFQARLWNYISRGHNPPLDFSYRKVILKEWRGVGANREMGREEGEKYMHKIGPGTPSCATTFIFTCRRSVKRSPQHSDPGSYKLPSVREPSFSKVQIYNVRDLMITAYNLNWNWNSSTISNWIFMQNGKR